VVHPKGEHIPGAATRRIALNRRFYFPIALVALSLLSACNSNFGMPRSASQSGAEVSRLWRLFVTVALCVGALVWALILWSVIRYRGRRDQLPKQTLFNIPMEIAYTIIPLILVGFLFAFSFRVTRSVGILASRPDLTIEATGFQWQWRFNYPDKGVDIIGQTDKPAEMVVPEGATVRIILTSTDVIHAFFVPEFMVKHDAIPGRKTAFDLKVTRLGTFTSGRCAEYCGLNHDKMDFVVRAVPQAEFDAWAAVQKAGSQT
jgi:cytochrome c oxidase subunit 2